MSDDRTPHIKKETEVTDVQITPTITTGQILTMLTFAGVFIGTAITIYFKLKEQWIISQQNMEARLKKHQEQLTSDQTAELQSCIHQIPNHPENIKPVEENNGTPV